MCSADCPEYIIAVPGTFISANRGYPVEINIDDLIVDKDKLTKFMEFIVKYSVPIALKDLKWYLSSYWG